MTHGLRRIGWGALILIAAAGYASIPILGLPALPWRVQVVAESPNCGWVISTAGRIHGPDSPYRPLVNTTHCYPTRAAAEAALQTE